ncbi:MAG TPA: DUF4325 domain-containing protein [Abditibacteriaceae bacterium]|jgi:hypothetical protein
MKKVIRKSLGEFGMHLAMRPNGRKVQEALDAELRKLPAGGVLVVDFDGVEMMDYSFADEAFGTLYSRMSAREYPDRHLVLAAREDELGKALMENIEVALSRREVAALFLPCDDAATLEKLLAQSDTENSARNTATWRIIGTLPQHLIETLGEVMNKGCVTVRELATALNLESATACNNRIAKLYQLHLVRREATIVPEGGRQYCYSAVV